MKKKELFKQSVNNFNRIQERLVEDFRRGACSNSSQESPSPRNPREIPAEIPTEMSRACLFIM